MAPLPDRHLAFVAELKLACVIPAGLPNHLNHIINENLYLVD